ncbi:transmembrane protease serine 9-like isoform X6 [Aquarana catesbeiana]|uniref:transmembrane protease serine 9-like isoform X6 n=1 Tax=Aquarana catesbeiana TaxID=8400 RepID=UPI003CCA104C
MRKLKRFKFMIRKFCFSQINERADKRDLLNVFHSAGMGMLIALVLLATAGNAFGAADSVCGSPSVSSRIVGGADSLDGEWPWQVAVIYNRTSLCGGSLISPEWVMTAAQCIHQPIQLSNYTVLLGMYKLGVFSSHTVVANVSNIIVNTNFTRNGDPGDIALVQLASPVNYTQYIMPICLPSNITTFPCGTECWVTGWGTTSSGGSIVLDRALQEVMVPLIDRYTCQDMYHNAGSAYSIQYDQICAGYKEGGKDSCQGDSGGPLVCKVQGVWYQVGVVSWRMGCAEPNFSGVYTLVTAYQAWISTYLNVTFNYVSNIPAPTSPCGVCGSPSVSSRIVGGTDSLDGKWPWQVYVTDGQYMCGGSLISQEWVMTAAQCIQNPIQVSNYKVYLGMYQLGVISPHTVIANVKNIIVNSQYSSINTPGDIALIQLASPVTYTQYIMPICLPSSSTTFPCGTECWVTGWGTRSSGGSVVLNGTLQEVMVPLIDRNTCQTMYTNAGGDITIQNDQICAGYKDGGKGFCQGDGGGPLVCKVQGVWYQVGIVSLGIGCAKPNYPGVYTLVTSYQTWISTNLNVAFNYVSNIPTPTMTCGGNYNTGNSSSIRSTVYPYTSVPLSTMPSKVCGSPLVSSRIVGGADSLDGKWPWQVAVIDKELNGTYLCGGSLISQEWVMTAAHCIQNPIQLSNYKVYLGMYQLGVTGPHTVITNVKNIIVNSQYSSVYTPGDIALLQLASPVTYTQYIMPICLPSSTTTFPCGTECWVTGWGTRSSGGSVVLNGTLQEVMVPLIDRNTCQTMYTNAGGAITIQNDQICAGYKDGGKGPCQGDGGGPLVCKVQGAWYQVGIVSSGIGCAKPNYPGVYTLVTSYQNWISTYLNVAFNYVSNIPTPTMTCGGNYINTGNSSSVGSTVYPYTSVPLSTMPSKVCGSPSVSSRIVGGTDSLDGKWPWHVYVTDGQYMCGGSLISQEWVMTAAQCIQKPIQVSNYKVYLGMYQLDVISPHTVITKVKNIIVNSQYSSVYTPGDIALLQLASPVTYTQYIMPICLPSSTTTFPCGTECWVTGWGTRSYGGSLVLNGTLQEVMVPLIDRNTCQTMYNNAGGAITIQNDQICAGYKDGGKGFCQGDLGGPLVCKVQGVWYQVGVASSGLGCAKPNYPGLYTLVTSYQTWISTNLNVAFNYVSNIPTPTMTCGGNNNNPVCGSPLVSSRIVGGTNSLDGAWPWQVAVIHTESGLIGTCGGSLISPEWVMTAAQCIHKPIQVSNYKVYLGMYQLDVTSPHTVIANVRNIIVNDKYIDTTNPGDIALIQLATPVTYTQYIKPICLPSSTTTFPCGTECWVTGWGTRYSGAPASSISNGLLQEVMVPLIDRYTCQKMYTKAGSSSAIQYDQICAGYKEGGKDSCQGDSGGPLVCKVQGVWYQVGIVSWGKGCAFPNFPGVYTQVTSYQDWISKYLDVNFNYVSNIPKPTRVCGGSPLLTSSFSHHRWLILVPTILLLTLI